jgi:hypothetical protein
MPLVGGPGWFIQRERFRRSDGKRNQETRKTKFRSNTSYDVSRNVFMNCVTGRDTLCAVPSKSETRQPDAIRKTRPFQLELAKGLEPPTL